MAHRSLLHKAFTLEAVGIEFQELVVWQLKRRHTLDRFRPLLLRFKCLRGVRTPC